jgi:sortase A
MLTMKKAARLTGWGLLVAGAIVLGVLGYQFWFTDQVTERAQISGAHEFERRVEALRPTLTLPADPEPQPQSVQAAAPPQLLTEPIPEAGAAFARIQIPSIDVDEIVFEGVDVPTLRLGPGHMPWTPLPGQPGNATLSGHRTTYGAPFNRIDELKIGARIVVETALGRHVYRVIESLVVAPTDVWVTDPRAGGFLTLTTCHPEFSSRERFVVHAELVRGPNQRFVEWYGDQVLDEVAEQS